MRSRLRTKVTPNRSKITMTNEKEVKYCMKHLGVTHGELNRAVERVGNSAASVRKELRTRTLQRGWPRTVIHSVCKGQLTNSFFLTDRCSLSDQISFILASNWRAFTLAMRDRDRANKNEIEIFVFSVTSNDFHDMLPLIFSLKIGVAVRCQGISGRS